MEMGKRIKELRVASGMTQEELGEKIGLQKSAVAKYENGRVENIKKSTIMKLAEIFNCRPSYVMGFDDDPIQQAVYEAAAGQGRINGNYASDTFDGYALKEDEVLVSVKGDSMYPTLQDGDIVVVKQQNVLSRSGQIALVKINGDEAVLKRIEQKSNGVVLISDNANSYPPRFFTDVEVGELPVCIEGVVVRLIRDL